MEKSKFTRVVSMVLCMLLVLSLIGCGGNQQTKTTNENGNSTTSASVDTSIIKIAVDRNISALNGMSGTATGFSVAYEIFDVLAALTEDNSLRPNLATSWEQIDDYTWKFSLRKGVTFHDGSPFNAESVAYTINYIAGMSPTYSLKGQWANSWPPQAVVVDEYTVNIVTPAPNLRVPQLLNRVPMLPLNAMDDKDFFQHPVGTGPYKFASWKAGVNVKLEANPKYWDGEPAVHNLLFDIITDETARMNAMKTGEYNFVLGVPYDTADELRTNKGTGMELVEKESTGVSYFYYNFQSDNKFIQDINFRKALQYGIDSQGIVDAILTNNVELLTGVSPQNVKSAYSAPDGFPKRDLEKCKKLIEECGYDGSEIVLVYPSSQFQKDLEVAELIISQLQEAGLNIKLEQIDSAAWDEKRATGSWDISINNLGGTYTGDTELYYTQSLKKQYWVLDEVEKLLTTLYLPGVTDEIRDKTLKDMMHLCWEETPFLWGVDGAILCAKTPSLEGIEILPMGIYRYTYAHYN